MVDKPDHPLNVAGEPRAFFGRRSGKRLHAGQDALYREMLPRLVVALGEEPLDLQALFPGALRFGLEIGFGGGEHLARQAAANPDMGFIGCEVFSGGIAKLLQAIGEQGLSNIRLFTDDAIKLLGKVPKDVLDAVWLLYPDPWPKTRHHKRRFISPTTVAAIARVLKPGAPFHFATDIEDYANWTLAHIVREPRLRFETAGPGSWHVPWPGWQPTRYEHKARQDGRMRSFYFTFRRV